MAKQLESTGMPCAAVAVADTFPNRTASGLSQHLAPNCPTPAAPLHLLQQLSLLWHRAEGGDPPQQRHCQVGAECQQSGQRRLLVG